MRGSSSTTLVAVAWRRGASTCSRSSSEPLVIISHRMPSPVLGGRKAGEAERGPRCENTCGLGLGGWDGAGHWAAVWCGSGRLGL
jgi:hypothetical protein